MNRPFTTVLVPLTFDDGTIVYIEAVQDESVQTGGRVLASSSSDVLGRFSSVTAAIRNIAEQINDAIADAAPNEAEVEFGLDMKVEPGGLAALVVKGDASASLKVTLKWTREKPSS